MNYYPQNFYSNYPQAYNNNLYTNNNQSMLPQPQYSPNNSGIPGKIVDSIDVAKVSDIPFGGYGIFPRADLSEIYVKMWNRDGTTSVSTLRPVIEAQVVQRDSGGKELPAADYEKLFKKIEELEKKIIEIQSIDTKKKGVEF